MVKLRSRRTVAFVFLALSCSLTPSLLCSSSPFLRALAPGGNELPCREELCGEARVARSDTLASNPRDLRPAAATQVSLEVGHLRPSTSHVSEPRKDPSAVQPWEDCSPS